MFSFSVTDVRAVITRGRIDAVLNGGFRNPHGLTPGQNERPGLWLVGDEGVYIMSNGKLAEDQRPLVVYAQECDPKTNPDYWHYKRQHFGGDDGVEFFDAAVLVKLIDAATAAVAIPVRCPAQGFAPLGHPDRDARPQLHRPVRSAGWEWSSGRRLNRTGRGRVPHPLKELPPCIS